MAKREYVTWAKGVYREPPSRTYRLRREAPADVRKAVGRREWDISLNTDSANEAAIRAADQRALWDRDIARARRVVAQPAITDVTAAIGTVVLRGWWHTSLEVENSRDTWPEQWRRLLKADKTTLFVAPPLALVLANLRHALETNDYQHVHGLKAAQADLLQRAGYDVEEDSPLWVELQPRVAKLWLLALEESERLRLHAALTAASSTVAMPRQPLITMDVAHGYVPRAGDVTVAQLISSYRADRSRKHDEDTTTKKYGHIFRALEELSTPDTPVRSITRTQCKQIREKLRRVPANATKKWPGRSLSECIATADEDEDDHVRISPGTVNSYVSRLIAILNYAIEEEWLERNPARGLVEADLPVVRRRGFSSQELNTIFAAPLVKNDPGKRWTLALLTYSGARAAEVAQLRRADVRNYEGIDYIDFSVFDSTGKRTRDKRLKTGASERTVPIHPDLLAAGFLDWARDVDGERLFDWRPGPTGGYSHYLSRWFGELLDELDLTDPCLVLHSMRHGFRDRCEAAGLNDRLTRNLGGWRLSSQADRYGASQLSVLRDAIARIEFGELRV